MRKGFTLVELLVVVVVIVTLMAITFRLSSAGSDQSARARTINRMQRLENCLSGYYAAYGSYPPVALHGYRDYTYSVNRYGIQRDGNGSGGEQRETGPIRDDWASWKRVEAACRSQPVGMSTPFCDNDIDTYVREVSRILMEKHDSNEERYRSFRENDALASTFSAVCDNTIIDELKDKRGWTEAQVFRFGLLSYLLPRLLVICDPPQRDISYSSFEQVYTNHRQWLDNNELPCDIATGLPYGSWSAVIAEAKDKNLRWKIAAMPSQAICARWMPNLEGIVRGGGVYYGVDTQDDYYGSGMVSADTAYPRIYAVSEGSQQYLLNEKTAVDGWANEFYYYSPTPHQSYTLWSAGANGKTFPPWISDEALKDMGGDERAVVQKWIADDIVHMQN